MIGSFMDESFDIRQSGIFAVGGLMGRGVATFELERRWEKLRKRRDIDIEYFKASQCERGSGEFAKFCKIPEHPTAEEKDKLQAISLEFHDAIVNMPFEPHSFVIAFGVGVIQGDFYEVTRDVRAKSVLGASPYWLAYSLAMIQCAWAMKELGTGDHVAFVCDLCEEHSAVAPDVYQHLIKTNQEAARYMGLYGMADEKKCEPLQAADAVIYEIRKLLNLTYTQREDEIRKQFKILADTRVMFIMQTAKKEQLLHIVSTHKPGEPLKLDEIMNQKFHENIRFGV